MEEWNNEWYEHFKLVYRNNAKQILNHPDLALLIKHEKQEGQHSWVWQRPYIGKRTCSKCGMVVSIQNHKKVGRCKPTPEFEFVSLSEILKEV